MSRIDIVAARSIGRKTMKVVWLGSEKESAPLRDLFADADHELVAAGASAAPADVIVSCFRDAEELEGAIRGDASAPRLVAAGGLWIDLTVADVDVARRVGAAASAAGISFADAPFTGWYSAPRGTRVFVGADGDALERAVVLLNEVGFDARPVGAVGAGQVVTFCDRALLATALVAQGESRVTARRNGLSDAVYRHATADGSSNQLLNYPIQHQVAGGPGSEGTGPTSVEMVERTLRAGLRAGLGAGVPSPITSQSWKAFARAVRTGLADRTVGDVMEVLIDRAGYADASEFDGRPFGDRPPRGEVAKESGRTSVGLIGLGIIGSLIAEGLARAGYRVVAFDLKPSAREFVEGLGGVFMSSAAAVAREVDLVLSSLPGPDEVLAAVGGPDGVLEGMSEGSLLFEMTTSDPEVTRALAARAAEKGARIIDAAVSRGGPLGGAAGDFALWIGATREEVEPYLPVLDTIGNKNTFCEGVGLGQTVKICNNYVSQVSDAITGETYVYAAAFGVSPLDLYAAIFPDSDGALLFGRRWPDCALINNFRPRLRLVLGRKDLGLGIELARRTSVPVSVGPAAYETFSEALAAGYGDYDRSGILMSQELSAGVKVVDRTHELVR
jgi:3-hydroxyisobutyrate dehydrogenase